MAERTVTVQQLLDILPEQPDFELLRQALARVAATNPQERWASSADYATVDERAIPIALIGQVLAEVESNSRRRLKRLFDAATIGFSAVIDGGIDEKIRQLIASGEAAEVSEQVRDAVAHYSIAVRLARLHHDPALRALTHARLGRAWVGCAEYARASSSYSSSLAIAAAVGDTKAQITACMGLGNVSGSQGRWAEGATWYRQALDRCVAGFELERGQACINLSSCARELSNFADAGMWSQQAHELWDLLPTSERAAWWNNFGLLRLEVGDLHEAEIAFQRGLDYASNHFYRAHILDNLAENAIRQGRLEVAALRAREAEEHAAALGSPRVLAEVYMRLGRIARLRHDLNGVKFFEKALALGRAGTFPLTLGLLLHEYGLFRKFLDDEVAARQLFVEAFEIFSRLGALKNLEAVQHELRSGPLETASRSG